MKRSIIVLLIILSLSFIIGCKATPNNKGNITKTDNTKTDVIKTDKPSEYYPLTKGSYWEYEGAGNEYASFTRKVLFAKGQYAQTSEDNGGTVITRIIETTDETLKIVYFEPESYQPANLLETNFTPNSETIVLKAPIKVGTSWTDKDGKKEIVAVDSVIDTPAGKFDNCLKIKIANQNDTIYQYYKKGVGMVKQEFISGDTTISSTLKKYKIE